MGLTGAGKSKFIERVTGLEAGVGHSLSSETNSLVPYCFESGNRRICLVDTPGFDDSRCNDTEIFKEIAFYLRMAYENRIPLGGILYLHRITDNRVSGAAERSFQLIRKICGPEGAKSVRLVTTMWDEIARGSGYEGAKAREEQLKSNENYWGWMVSNGSRVQRSMATSASAHSILGSLLDVADTTGSASLQLQKELTNEGKDFLKTASGFELGQQHSKSWEQASTALKVLLMQQLNTEEGFAQRLRLEGQMNVAATREQDLEEDIELSFKKKMKNYWRLFVKGTKEVSMLSKEISKLEERLSELNDRASSANRAEKTEDKSSEQGRAPSRRLSQARGYNPQAKNKQLPFPELSELQEQLNEMKDHAANRAETTERKSIEQGRAPSRKLFQARVSNLDAETTQPSSPQQSARSNPTRRSTPSTSSDLQPPQGNPRLKAKKRLKKGKGDPCFDNMTEEEKTAYLRKKIARKERRKLATRNALAVLGMLGGVATIAAGAATLQIPVVAAGIALFGTAGMKLDFSRKKKKRPEDEKAWEVSEHD
ncbi:hypothetical protein BKA59DRAFT_122183 [Fusarium tricinctum]|uniref:G domain-containing protein n=1 Tax=Fusarium tricinctum TaxID=61284 RepID=A0A8K0WGL8_9HYPO|nr:hypothetical protein BKA59DRAFT_122183 [Fusarium tricinctum]